MEHGNRERSKSEDEEQEMVSWGEIPWIDRPSVDIVVCSVVVLSAILMGVELDMSPKEATTISDRLAWYVMEVIFGLIFMIELSFRLKVHRFEYFKTTMNIFDAFMVLLTILDTFILSPMEAGGSTRAVGVLRIIRMVRLVRLIRLLPHFKELWLVVNGLANSMKTLSWTSILLMVTLYFFGIFATMQIGQNDELYNVYYEETSGHWDHEIYFGTIPRSMLTFFQICVLDEWSENIVRHVKFNQPGMEWMFVAFIFFTSFGILNIVVGVIVENVLMMAKVSDIKIKKKREKDRMRVLNHLRDFFEQSDEDGSGTLSLEEVQVAMDNPENRKRLALMDLPIDEPTELFTLLDVDNSGEISIDEFISGCMRIKGTAKSKDILALQIMIDSLGSKMSDLANALDTNSDKINQLDGMTAKMLVKSEQVFRPERERRRQSLDLS
eukprot:gnl/MRDRNA2_/MRDRNA2_100833_c0_seq1.p1 gnl/MRDRNA2_/MRDRNA2_100833_c0~~gnl/MRDRNA2_/MRDRNA2_100833_c0_seq1.p1  ORF type:complete len:439 (+),score=70.39 gnl/MRDRNA2_/MRDRNA2_100833_c0_seq1:179-1495(+)